MPKRLTSFLYCQLLINCLQNSYISQCEKEKYIFKCECRFCYFIFWYFINCIIYKGLFATIWKGHATKNYSLDRVPQYDVVLKMGVSRENLLITKIRARGDFKTSLNYLSATRQDQLYKNYYWEMSLKTSKDRLNKLPCNPFQSFNILAVRNFPRLSWLWFCFVVLFFFRFTSLCFFYHGEYRKYQFFPLHFQS